MLHTADQQVPENQFKPNLIYANFKSYIYIYIFIITKHKNEIKKTRVKIQLWKGWIFSCPKQTVEEKRRECIILGCSTNSDKRIGKHDQILLRKKELSAGVDND